MLEHNITPSNSLSIEQFKDTDFSAFSSHFESHNINPESIKNHVDELLQEEKQLSEEILSRIINLDKPEPDIEFLLEKDGVGCFPTGDIGVLKGKQKAGKSTLLACWITALSKGDYMNFKALILGCLIVYIDTEQNPANTRRLIKKIHSLCGYPTNLNNPNILVINLREIILKIELNIFWKQFKNSNLKC